MISKPLIPKSGYELLIELNVVATDIKGLTINFGEVYPTRFDILTSSGQRIEIADNDQSEFSTEQVLENTTYIKFIFYKMKNPYSRLRIYSIQLGYGLVYYNDDIMDSKLDSYISPICEDVPQIDFMVKLQNYDQYFNVDNPNSAINLTGYEKPKDQGQKVKATRGSYAKEYYNQFAVKKEEKTMKVIIGSARRDENGKYAGGKPGDQDGVEVSTQNYYVHTKGWYMFRFLSDEHAKKVAKAMWDACMNNNIGYCQAHRSIMAMLKKYGNMKAIGEKTEADCSDLVRGCIYEATGIDVGAFSTATEPSVLEKSGLFAKKVSVTSATVLKPGDILVTKSKGHTVIVVSVGGSAPSGSTSTSKPAVSGSTARVESARSKDAAIAGKYKTTSNLYLRVGAGTGKTAITLMPAGSSVQCYGYYTTYNGTRWYYVAYGDKTGFCSSAYLRKA